MNDPLAELATLLTAHLDFINDLDTRGILFGAGPFRHEDGKWDSSGMTIVCAASIEEPAPSPSPHRSTRPNCAPAV